MLISRQPVFDETTTVQGYQSLTQGRVAGDGSRRDVLEIIAGNINELAGKHWAIVTLPLETIESGAHEILHRDRTMVRPLGKPTDPLFQRCLRKLSAQGYRLVVPAPEDGSPASEYAQIVHLDFATCDWNVLAANVHRLRGRHLRIMVGGIGTYDDLARCKAAGVDLFEGRFFCQAMPGTDELPVTRIPTMRLLAALQNPDIRFKDLEDLVRHSLPLTYKLLNFTNSIYVGLNRPVESVKHAVGLIGIERIRKWASLFLYSTVEEKPRELFVTAAVRARMCEQLADSNDEWRQSVFFTVGLLSVLNAVLDRPIAEIVEVLPLTSEVRDGLVHGAGTLGSTLRAVTDYESGDFDSVSLRSYHPTLIRNTYFEALHWTREVSDGLMI